MVKNETTDNKTEAQEDYFFPELGVTVQAPVGTSHEDALKLAKAQSKKLEATEGSDND